jgi:antitoxin YefM
MAEADIQYVSNEGGEPTAVIVPISLWRAIESERETAYLQGLSLDQAVRRLGI